MSADRDRRSGLPVTSRLGEPLDSDIPLHHHDAMTRMIGLGFLPVTVSDFKSMITETRIIAGFTGKSRSLQTRIAGFTQ